MRKLLLLFLFISQAAWAELPLSFTSSPTVSNMAIGQIQVLNYTIRNNLQKTALPLQSISIINAGDQQATDAVTTENTCPTLLPPQTSCSVTVVVDNPQQGQINRRLSIAYGGRAPLTAPITLQTSQAAYTILVYIVGANLESEFDAASSNIEQMKEIGSTSNINIVIETGGANKPGWRTAKRKFILHNAEYLLQDLGSLNMGLESTIQSFLEWGVTRYPADKYFLIFWNHGGGPNYGYGGDEVHDDAATPIKQLSAAVRATLQNTGKRFEIIGFDTCLLGNIETISGLYPYTNYVIGSEDLEPGEGWQYNTFLSFINNNPKANGLAIGKVVVDGFTAQNSDDTTTLSVVSSNEVPNLLSAIDQFATALLPYVNTSTTNWKQIARARLRTPDYGTSVWELGGYDVADLTGLATSMATVFPADSLIQSSSATLIAAIQNAVKYYKNSENRGASYGLTVYFPSILARYVTTYPNATILNGSSFFSTNYTNMIANYYNFYLAQANNLIAEINSLAFNGTSYTATVTHDFEELYASAGNEACTNVFAADNTHLGPVPCYTALQSQGITATPAAGDSWNVEYNKALHFAEWPLINGEPALLVALDTEPVQPNEISYLIPVTSVVGGRNGYLSLYKNESNEFVVDGFQASAGNANTQAKVTEIPNGTQFYLKTYALNGSWGFYRTDTIITAPFTISFGTLPAQFNAFRFLVAGLTGQLNITNSSESY